MNLLRFDRIDDEGRWAMRTPYHELFPELAKKVPGLKWVPREGAWIGYGDAVSLMATQLEAAKVVKVAGPRPTPRGPLSVKMLSRDYGLRGYQTVGANFIMDTAREGCLLADSMGLGKAQPVSAKVMTPTGWRSIGDIQVGDFVYGSKGIPIRVTGVFPQTKRKIFRITFTDGTSSRSCAEHLWRVETPVDRYRRTNKLPVPIRILPLNEIAAQGLLGVNTNKKWFVPIAAPIQFTRKEFVLDPYLVGALIANGSIGHGHTAHHGDSQQRAAMQKISPKSIMIVRQKNKWASGLNCAPGYATNIVTAEMRRLGLAGTESNSKFIPDEYMLGSVEQRLALLQGLMDNDGTVAKDGFVCEYNTVSKRLADSVVDLVRSLGGVARRSSRIPTYTYKGERLTGQRDYRTRLSMPDGIVPFRIKRKTDRYVPRTKYPPAHAIESIVAAGSEKCVCIAVEAEDHLYVTDDYILTHNTSSTLAAINEGLDLPAVIVSPANVKSSWKNEASRLGLDAHLLFGMKPPVDCQLSKSDGIVVLNYELVDSWLPHLNDVKTVVFDEVHLLTNEKSKRSKACRELARRAKYRAALSGTPFLNKPKELWNIIDTLSPGRFGKWMPFMKRYAGAFQEEVPLRGGEEGETQKVWNTKGASHTDELAERLKFFMLRRTKQDVKLEIPAKTRQLIEVDVSKQYKNPDRWWSLENTNNTQIALGLAAEGKIEPAVELALNAIGSESNVVLFVYRKSVAKMLKKRLAKDGVKAFMLTGDESPNQRQANAEQAKAQGKSVCIATIDAVGTGVNYLAFADVAVFVELHYVPGKMLQGEDRLHRFGQVNPVTIIYLIALGSIDEMIRDVVLQKLKAFEEVIGNTGDTIRDDLLGGLSDEEAFDALRKVLMEDEGNL